MGNNFIDVSTASNMDEFKSIMSYRVHCLKAASRILLVFLFLLLLFLNQSNNASASSNVTYSVILNNKEIINGRYKTEMNKSM